MKQILLLCNAECRQMLIKKMQQVRLNVDWRFHRLNPYKAKKNIHEADVILIGPQIRYELPAVKEIAGGILECRYAWLQDEWPKVLDQT